MNKYLLETVLGKSEFLQVYMCKKCQEKEKFLLEICLALMSNDFRTAKDLAKICLRELKKNEQGNSC